MTRLLAAAFCLAIAIAIALALVPGAWAQEDGPARRQRPQDNIAVDITPKPAWAGGYPLIDGVIGDASRDAAGETQLFEQIFIAGVSNYARTVRGVAFGDLDKDGSIIARRAGHCLRTYQISDRRYRTHGEGSR